MAASLGTANLFLQVSDRITSIIKYIPFGVNTHDGYRTDCFGFVSATWETSKPGYTTFMMPQIAKEPKKHSEMRE